MKKGCTFFVIALIAWAQAQQEIPGGGVPSSTDITLARAIAIEKQAHASFGFPPIQTSTIRWRLEGRVQSRSGRSYSLNTPDFWYTIEARRGRIETFMNKRRIEERDKRKNRTNERRINSANEGKTYALEMLRKIGAPQPLEVSASGLTGDRYKTGKTDHDNLAQYHIFVKNTQYGYVASMELDAQDGVVLHFTESAKEESGWNRRQ